MSTTRRFVPMVLMALGAALVFPALGLADENPYAKPPTLAHDQSAVPAEFNIGSSINTMWVVVAATLVIFMQAGFALLEIGFSRGKNVGTIVAKILTNFSIAAFMWWICGFALAFGNGKYFGNSAGLFDQAGGWFFSMPNLVDGVPSGGFSEAFQTTFGVMSFSSASVPSKFLFQFSFCAVSLAIVWGTTLERIKFGAYILYAIVFAGLIYPLGAHWVFGGGFLQDGAFGLPGVQDFAGSTAVHLIGATGALAALLLLGPRRGKYGPDGKPRAIPGHNMPLFGLGVIILLIGWVGFNGGSTLMAVDGRAPEVIMITMFAAAAGVLAALLVSKIKMGTLDIGMAGNGAIAALVGITAGSGYVALWAAPIIGAVAGAIVVIGVLAIDKKLDDPVGALSAHGLAGIWGTLACGIFTVPELAQYNAWGDPEGGLVYSGSFDQLAAQAVTVVIAFVFVFVMSYITFWVIKKTYGLRVTPEEENAGLDISEHGMYGYPEQFIPAAELSGYGAVPASQRVGTGPVSDPEVTA
ncbi:MAG: ammonium transporter [Actinomycetes bacterium]